MSGEVTSRPAPITIAADLLHEVYREARRCFPAECCGWLAGDRKGHEVNAIRICHNAQEESAHPSADERSAETAYVIAGADLVALNKELDGLSPAKIIFHSHPNGRAYFSETDHRVATSPWGDGPMYPVQQLVVGIDGERVVEAALFAWSDADDGFVEIQRFVGADL